MSFGPIPVNYIGEMGVLWQAAGPPDGWHIPVGAHRLTIGTWNVSTAQTGQPRWYVYWDFYDEDLFDDLCPSLGWHLFHQIMSEVAAAVAANRTAG